MSDEDDAKTGLGADTGAKTLKGRRGAPSDRNDRLKAALKANMARRKAQTRARASGDGSNEKE